MKRLSTKPITPDSVQYNNLEEPIILSKPILDLLMQEPKHAELIALYIFYYSKAKWQGTPQLKASTLYVMQELEWTEEKVLRIKKRLKELQLIEDIVIHSVGNKILGHYIKVNLSIPVPHSYQVLGNIGKKKSDSKEKDTKKKIIIKEKDEDGITFSMFENFWEIYPKKVDKGKALTSWKKICNKPLKDRPTWKEIRRAVSLQIKSERWQERSFIPHPATWLNQSRWLDDPKEMKAYKRNSEFTSRMKPFIIDDGIQYDLGPDGKYHHCVTGEVYIP